MKDFFNKIFKALLIFFPVIANSTPKQKEVESKQNNTIDDLEIKQVDVNNPHFFNRIKLRIQNSDYEYDYLSEAKSVKIEDAEFWYNYSAVLRSLPESNSMDLRENGTLATADYASNRCYEISPDSAGAIAERILVLNMLTHGLSSMQNAGLTSVLEYGNIKERYAELLGSLNKMIYESSQKFPDDVWFQEQKMDFEENFGS